MTSDIMEGRKKIHVTKPKKFETRVLLLLLLYIGRAAFI